MVAWIVLYLVFLCVHFVYFHAGRDNVGALVENAISGQSMGALIFQPSGDGEVNMVHMTQLVIATTYLDKTNQWEAVGFQKRNEALQHIRAGKLTHTVLANTHDH